MFAKVKDRLDAAAKGPVRPTGTGDRAMPSIIGPDMVVSGNLDTPGEIHIEGRIEGDVTCSKLNVGPTGKIHGKVKAGSVRVHGLVDGAIDADEVFLLSGSVVSGDIVQTSLEIAPGASFEGAVRRRGTAAVPQLQAPTVVDVAAVEDAVEVSDDGSPTDSEAAKADGTADGTTAAEADTPANDSGTSPASATTDTGPAKEAAKDAGRDSARDSGKDAGRTREKMAAAGR